MTRMRGKRALNNKFRSGNGAVTVSCACPDCEGIRSASRASEKNEMLADIIEQLEPPAPYEPDFLQPPYRRYEDAHPDLDDWIRYVDEPDANPEEVAAIRSHLATYPDCDCDFLPARNPKSRLLGVHCAHCGVDVLWMGARSDEFDEHDPVLMAIWGHLRAQYNVPDGESIFICACCWPTVVTLLKGPLDGNATARTVSQHDE